MSNTEMNRQIVQKGLDKKKTSRRQRMDKAAHEAAERQLWDTINKRSKEYQEAIEAAEAEARRKEERKEAARAHRAEAREQERMYVDQMTNFFVAVFRFLLCAVILTYCYIYAGTSAWVAFPGIGLSVVNCVLVLAKCAGWIRKEKVAA